MSIIQGYLIARKLQSLWFIPLIIWVVTIISMVGFKAYPVFEFVYGITQILAVFSLVAFTFTLLEWVKQQKPTIRFSNVREALNGGFMSIVTNNDDSLREIADAVSCYLSQLGIDHLGKNSYEKHIVIEANKINSLSALVASIRLAVPTACKLHLVIFPHKRINGEIWSIEYCLINNGGQSLLRSDSFNEWPVVYCSEMIFDKKKVVSQVAREIVGGLFSNLQLSIQAVTPPAYIGYP